MQSKVEKNDLGNDVASASFPEFFLTTSHKEFFPPLEEILALTFGIVMTGIVLFLQYMYEIVSVVGKFFRYQ